MSTAGSDDGDRPSAVVDKKKGRSTKHRGSAATGAHRADVDQRLAQEAEAVARLSSGPRRSIAMIAACPFPTHQGTQVFIRHLANALAAAGHGVHLVTYDESEGIEPSTLDARIAWHRAPTPKVGFRSGPSLARIGADAVLLRQTLTLLAGRAIDILHVHNAEGLAIGAVASRITGVPLIYHAHSRLDAELPLYAGSKLTGLAAQALGRAFERTLPRTAKAVICFDGEQAARFKRAGVSSSRLHVIPLGLSMDELAGATRSQKIRTGNRRLIYAGNPDAYQNLALLEAAYACVRTADPSVTLRLVSNHPRETFGTLGRAPGVDHFGFATPTELARLLNDGAAGLITRTLAVGAPVKALSYLSAHLPVVACTAGSGAFLGSFPEACTLTDATPEAFAAGILQRLASSTPRFDLIHRAFEITDQVATYEAVYVAATALGPN